MNKILRFLTISDLMILGSFGLINPIFALFLENEIKGFTIAAVGISSGIYLIIKSILQVIVSRFTDKDRGNKREYWAMITGSLLVAIIPIGYLLATKIEHIFIIQIFYGLGAALAYPGWMAIFTKFIDKQKEAFGWSLYDTLASLGGAVTATIGGILAQFFGFNTLFIIITVSSVLGACFLFIVRGEILLKNAKKS